MRYFLGRDPMTGISRWMDYDPATRETVEFAQSDVTHEVEASRQMANNAEFWKHGVKNDMALYAHIPAILLEKWLREGVDINDNAELVKMVNKPEYSYLKTTSKVHA